MGAAILVAVLCALIACTHSLRKVDVAFVIDGSRSIVPEEFNLSKDWIVRTVRDMRKEFGSLARFAVLQHSSKYKFEFPIGFNDCYRESEDVGHEIDKMHQLNDDSYFATGLLRVVETTFPNSDLFMSSLKYVFIITDGRFGDSGHLPKWREAAGKMGVAVFGLGISDFNLEELRAMTGCDDCAPFSNDEKRNGYLNEVKEFILESGAARAISNLDRDCRIKACEMGSRVEDYADTAFKASSSEAGKKPSDARLSGSSAWTPEKSTVGEYIQLDFGAIKQVGGVVIQGKQLGTSKQFVKSFKIGCRVTSDEFAVLEVDEKQKVFTGNTDATSEVVVTFEKSIGCRSLRILPVTWNNKITMRFGVLRGDCIKFF